MRLSVVVTIVDAGEALERCLSALAAQQNPPPLEVIVPWDDSVREMASLAVRYPQFHFLPMGTIDTQRHKFSAAGQHELYDRRRAAGLAIASGEIVAMVEDRGVPRPDWAGTMVQLHGQLPHAAIGGAIENGRSSVLHWAVYFCDFGRFAGPFSPGPRRWVSDINVGYKRRALERTRHLWHERYHETTVHWALERGGDTLYVSPGPVVDQMRGPLRLGDLMLERFAWGRLFASTRAVESIWPTRLALALLTPFLPPLLLARQAAAQLPRNPGRFIKAAPLVLLLLVSWSLGEAVGDITGEP